MDLVLFGWVHRTSKKKVAIKQILTKNPHEIHLKEIRFGTYFFEKGDKPGNNLKIILFADYLPTKFTVSIHDYTIKYATNLYEILTKMFKYKNPWVSDVWSLRHIIL